MNQADRRGALGAAPGAALRRCLWLAAALSTLLAVSPVQAGSYLYRTSLLLADADRDSAALRVRLGDRELARMVHMMADARVRAASTMAVPKEVVQAHPHLLLILESYERAADAAARGGHERFLSYTQRAWAEEQVLRAVLKQLGWQLPSLQPGPR